MADGGALGSLGFFFFFFFGGSVPSMAGLVGLLDAFELVTALSLGAVGFFSELVLAASSFFVVLEKKPLEVGEDVDGEGCGGLLEDFFIGSPCGAGLAAGFESGFVAATVGLVGKAGLGGATGASGTPEDIGVFAVTGTAFSCGVDILLATADEAASFTGIASFGFATTGLAATAGMGDDIGVEVGAVELLLVSPGGEF